MDTSTSRRPAAAEAPTTSPGTPTARRPSPTSVRDYVNRLRGGDMGSLPALLGLVVLFTCLPWPHDKFLTTYNLTNLVIQAASICVLAMGLVFVLLLGEIDLSAGVAGGASATITALVILDHGWTWWAAVARRDRDGGGHRPGHRPAGLTARHPVVRGHPCLLPRAAGIPLKLIGSGGSFRFNDEVLRGLSIKNMPVTAGWIAAIALVVGFAALSLWQHRSRVAKGLVHKPFALVVVQIVVLHRRGPRPHLLLSQNRAVNPAIFNISGIPWVAPVVIALLLFWTFVLTRTRFGRHLYAVGGNAEAARRAGINVGRMKIAAFVICSGMAAVSGILAASYTGKVSPGSGGGNELLYAVGRGRHRRHQPVRRSWPGDRRGHRRSGHRDHPQRPGPARPGELHQLRRDRRGSAAGRQRRRRSRAAAVPPPGSSVASAQRAGTGTNQEAVRRHNLGTLLRHVHDSGEVSRAELTGRMGLNRSTIAALVTELDALALIEHTVPDDGPTRRRPALGRRAHPRRRAVRRRRRPRRGPRGRRPGRLGRPGLATRLRPDSPGARGVAGRGDRGRPAPACRRDVASRRSPDRDRRRGPGSGAAQRRPDPARPEPQLARRVLRLDRARGAVARHPDRARQRRRPRRSRRAAPGRGRGSRRPGLPVRQRRCRRRRHHRGQPARGRRRLRRRDRPPLPRPARSDLPLRQPRLLGDGGRCAGHRRGAALPGRSGRAARRDPRRHDHGAARAPADRDRARSRTRRGRRTSSTRAS